MNTSTQYPSWALPVMSAVLIYLLYTGWRRKDIYNRLKMNFHVSVEDHFECDLRNKIQEINDLNKTVLTVYEIFYVRFKGVNLPLVSGTSTVTGGHWMGLRAYTYSGVYTVATDLAAKNALNLNNDIFKQASEPELSDIYFVKNMKKLEKAISR